MSKAINFYKASDGTPATDMSVALVGDWTDVVPGQPYSFEASQGAGATGVWSLEGSNADPVNALTPGNPVASTLFWVQPSQPAGSAGTTSLAVAATHDKMRPRYTPTSGGNGTAVSGRVGLGAGGVLTTTPDSTMPGLFTPTPAQAAYSSYLRG